MKAFDVYKHPAQGYQAVKQGFAWPAFGFSWIWAFVKKMWGLGFAFLGVLFLLLLVEAVFEQEENMGGVLLMFLAQLVFFIVVGAKGNDWRRGNLVKRGFEKLNTVEAATPDAAVASVAKTSSDQQAGPPNNPPERWEG